MNKNYIRKKMSELQGDKRLELRGTPEASIDKIVEIYYEVKGEMAHSFNLEWSHDRTRAWVTRGRLKSEHKGTTQYKDKIKNEQQY